MDSLVHRFEKAACPDCGAVVTAAGQVDASGLPVPGAGPTSGDLTLCPNCLQIWTFRVNGTSVVLAEPVETDLEGLGSEIILALKQARTVLLATKPLRWLVMIRMSDDGYTIGAFGPIRREDVSKRVHQIFGMRRASFVAEWCCSPREDQIRRHLEESEPDELTGIGSCIACYGSSLQSPVSSLQ